MNLKQFKRALTRPDEPWKDEERLFWDFLRNSVKTQDLFNSIYFEEAVEEILSWPPGKLEEMYVRWMIERGELGGN